MKKRFFSFFIAALMLTSCIFQSSCERRLERFSTYSFDYFDTVTSIVGYAQSREEFDRVSGEVLAELGEYHRLFTIYHRYEGLENLCTVNETVDGEHRTVQVDRRIIDMLLYAKEMYRKTEGQVNIAMGSVLSIWHDYREEGSEEPWAAKLPPMDLLEKAAEHTDIDKLVIDEEKCTVLLTDPDMTLDVGAVAKGYAVEMAARSLEEKGIGGYVINAGGNVRTVGLRGDGSRWIAGIDDPDGGDYLALLSLSGEALVTSGSYQRYYIVDGKRYHHIIDPDTLMPAEGFSSVSIVCKSSADGDILSTALFCMTAEEGLALVESMTDVEAMWVTDGGEILYSSGFHEFVG